MKASRRRAQKRWEQDMARQRIQILFSMARQCHVTHPERSRRYLQLARRIAMRYRVRLPRDMKRQMCKACNTFLLPPHTLRVRLRRGYLVYTCLHCGSEKRYPYKG